jgi:hypothetical protein
MPLQAMVNAKNSSPIVGRQAAVFQAKSPTNSATDPNFVPDLIVRIISAVVQVLFSSLKEIHGRHSVFIPSIPGVEDLPSRSRRGRLFKSSELVFRNLFGQGPPAVTVAQQNQEIGLGRNLLRAPQFLEANPHGAVVEACLTRDTPAQINGLELELPARAELLQLRDHVSLQGVAFMLEVRERRADEDPDDWPVADLGFAAIHVYSCWLTLILPARGSRDKLQT